MGEGMSEGFLQSTVSEIPILCFYAFVKFVINVYCLNKVC